ncbi:MAG: cupin domain-containing protein [Sediminibacterium sp.]|nr:cupin domain-containing protein [Sediminibacterium sp.]
MENSINQWVEKLQMVPHPEGGFYKENYRSTEYIESGCLPDRFAGRRPMSTAIYFLITAGNFSAFHRIKSDECWHFYAGDPLRVHLIDDSTGAYCSIELGNDLNGQGVLQAVVPAGYWFASETQPGGSFSLVGCTVAPGFNFADFELADRDALIAKSPEQAGLISRLTRIEN